MEIIQRRIDDWNVAAVDLLYATTYTGYRPSELYPELFLTSKIE
jgi:hypothetical protein